VHRLEAEDQQGGDQRRADGFYVVGRGDHLAHAAERLSVFDHRELSMFLLCPKRGFGFPERGDGDCEVAQGGRVVAGL